VREGDREVSQGNKCAKIFSSRFVTIILKYYTLGRLSHERERTYSLITSGGKI